MVMLMLSSAALTDRSRTFVSFLDCDFADFEAFDKESNSGFEDVESSFAKENWFSMLKASALASSSIVENWPFSMSAVADNSPAI